MNRAGQREILGMDVVTREAGAAWTAFLRSLVARGLSGVELVISDAHEGLKDAIGAVLVGATWQRCRTHFMRNLLTRVRKSAQPMVATLVRTVFAQPDAESTWAQRPEVDVEMQMSRVQLHGTGVMIVSGFGGGDDGGRGTTGHWCDLECVAARAAREIKTIEAAAVEDWRPIGSHFV